MKGFVLIIFALILTLSINAQLVVTTGALTPTQYVQNVLVGGGVTVSNVTFSGQSNQIGEFNATATNPLMGINNGIILATGDVNLAIGPNNSGSASLGGGNFGAGDSDLDILEGTGVGTNDAAILEFDFVPTGDTVKFNFVFGSEEYPEFVNSINDVFGFFLSGPGIAGPFSNGATNIALIPGTITPVTINTVNPGANAAFYFDNTPNTGAQTIQYDGYTVVLTAIGVVQCGVQYHIKIAIADASDTAWDSGVFLEAGSFSSNTVTLNSSIDVGGNDSILYEGCGSALLDFVRDNTTDTSVYNFIVTGTAGTSDYTISADSVVFLPGEDTVTITFDALQDGLGEPLETVIIQLVQTICSVVDTQTVTFYISDFPQPILTMHDTLKNCGSNDSVPIWVDVLGPPYTTLWNTGDITDTIWVNPLATTTYYVTVSDTCGVYSMVDSATVTVVIVSPIVLTTLNDTSKYCSQDSMLVYVTASGGGGNYTYSWNPGGATDSSIYVSPSATSIYIVDVQDVCGTIVQDSVIITVPIFVPLTNVITTNDTTICSGEIVILNANVAGGVGTYLSWNNGIGNIIPTNVNPVATTNYILTAQDSCGAIALDSVLVTISTSNLTVNMPNTITMDCLNETITLNTNVTGGLGTETYLWNTNDTTPSIQVNPIATTTYSVTITDVCSIFLDSTKVIVPIFAPLVLNVNNNITVNCPGDPVTLSANFNGGAQASLVINWTDGTNNYVGNNITVNPIVTTTYTATINDTCAFDSATASFTVTVPSYLPLQLTISNDTLVCVGDSLSLFALVSGGEGTYVYSWNGGFLTDTLDLQANYNANYNIIVTDGCGSQIASSVVVTVTSPTAGFSFEYLSEFAVQFTDSSYDNIVSSWWTFDQDGTYSETNPVYTFGSDGEHDVWLIVQDINGCYDTIMKTIRPPLFIYGPNSFSPDGDGINDEFKFKGIGIENFELMIFNRWGDLIFSSGSVNRGWDGTYKGKLVPVGVYVYKVRAESYEKRVFENAGSITIIK